MESINLHELIKSGPNFLPESFNKSNVIYKITNILNNDSYIGKTKSFKMRFFGNGIQNYSSMINKLVNSDIECNTTHLFNAFRRYGISNFEVSIIQHDIPDSDLSKIESYWISEFNTFLGNGYNMTQGGDGNPWSNSAWESSKESRMNLWPDTNGTPLQWISSGRLHQRKGAISAYPDTNGMAPWVPKIGNNQMRWNYAKRSYDALLETCLDYISKGGIKFPNGPEYRYYAKTYSPGYNKFTMSRSFRNYREFGFDISIISQCIRSDWQ